MKKFRVGALGFLVALTLLAPVVAGAVWVISAASESPLESASSVEPLVGVVETAERAGDSVVSIAVEFADALSPTLQASGTVTAVHVAPGDIVDTGTIIGEVNNLDLVAYVSAAPLWRDIYQGLRGDDVVVAQQMLNQLGFRAGSADGRAGPQTARAIEAFNKKYGYGDRNAVLSLTSLVWAGATPATVDSLTLAVGQSVGPGSEVFSTTAGLAAITVSESPSLPRDVDVVLIVGDVTVPYVVGSTRVTEPQDVVAIAASLGTLTEGVGTVRRLTPVTVGTVPSSAIVTDERGRMCMFADVTSPPQEVQPLGGTLGTVDLDTSLIGSPVLINPREVRQDLSCGS